MRRVVAALVLAAIPLGCTSAEDPGGTVVIDSGPKKDSGNTTGDSSVTDSTSPGSDTAGGGDTGGGGCNVHPGDECDLVKQNCTDATASCVYDGDVNHTVCLKIATGTKLRSESCATQGECDKGLECRNGKCSPFCCLKDDSPCGPGGSCSVQVTDEGASPYAYALCDYSPPCNPFKYDCPTGSVCLFNSLPDRFKCSTPSPGTPLNQAPLRECKYRNDCGESQGCSTITTSGEDAAAATAKCQLYCWFSKPTGFTPGTMPDGRFPADGTCTIGGVNYGTCRDFSSSGLGGGLGICVK